MASISSYGRLVRDRRLSHGAFRLWHCLRDYSNRSGKCFPGQRLLAKDLGCDIHSLKAWTAELVEAGWLKVDQKKNGLRFNYTLMDGTEEPLGKPTTPTVGERNNGNRCGKAQRGVVETHNGPLWKPTTEVNNPLSKRGASGKFLNLRRDVAMQSLKMGKERSK